MIDYADMNCQTDNMLSVRTHEHEAVHFVFGFEDEDEQKSSVIVRLDRDCVSALIGQLQSWLDRTEGKT